MVWGGGGGGGVASYSVPNLHVKVGNHCSKNCNLQCNADPDLIGLKADTCTSVCVNYG